MMATNHHALRSGTRLEQYELRSVLGTGGFGITYLGWDTRLDGPVAIKEYLPVECAWRTEGSRVVARTGNDQDNFDFGKQRFLEEARTLNRFSEPNIIRVRTFLEANDTAYMVMDYEEGEPLSALLEREGNLDEATLKNLMIPILDGLRAVHREQFLHRDIKPGNIYLRSEGSPVLLDFGAARQALGEHSRSMTGIVTAGYAPFEQYSSRGKQGPWTDLYAIGATMYRAISGHPPVESSERVAAVGEGDPDPLVPATEVGKGRYSEPLLSSIDWMLSLAAKDRPQSVEAVLERLLGSTAKQPQAVTVPAPKSTETDPPLSEATNPKKSRASPIGVAVILSGLFGLGSWAYMNGQAKTELQPTTPTRAPVSPAATKLQAVKTPPALVGHLQINVNVADALIRLDGKPVGLSRSDKPLILERLQTGIHKIEVIAEGYKVLSESIQVQAQEWTQLALQLEPENSFGELIVRSNVSGDRVYIDGKALGPTGKIAHRLPTGVHTVRVEKSGYKPFQTQVTINEAQQEVLVTRLTVDHKFYEPETISIQGGRFLMGSGIDDERKHWVTVNGFKIARTEVTQAQWRAVMSNNPSHFKGCDTCPVEKVSWNDVKKYIAKLNQRTGKQYRLPTEAEWEFACREGREEEIYCGGKNVDRTAWYQFNSKGETHPVGKKRANRLGLEDMSGNVWEWTCSAYNESYNGDEGRCADGASNAKRAVRGGAWFTYPQRTRSTSRSGYKPSTRNYGIGFRLAHD
ncbi:MAG: SUMF1/EgtB/PvdO family nonheme iron enzyme [Candidatus Thiodiazotropha taylori]